MPDSSPCPANQRPLNCGPQLLDGLYAVARFLTEPEEHPPKLERLVQMLERLELHRATVMLLGPDDRKLIIAAAQGVDRKQIEQVTYLRGEGVVGMVMETRQAITLVHPHLNPRFLNRVHRRPREVTERIIFICVPIVFNGRIVGTLSADIYRHSDINVDSAVRLLSIIAGLIAHRADALRPSSTTSLTDRVRTIEVDMISSALRNTDGNIAAAARQLGISARMARYKVRQLGIQL